MYKLFVRFPAIAAAAIALMQSTGAGQTPAIPVHDHAETRVHDHAGPERIAAIAAALGAREGAVIADIGAGSGDYTVKLSAVVGPGRVIAVDISPQALARLKTRVESAGLTNVQIIEGAVDNPKLATASIDAALIVNAYHEMTEYPAMLAHIRTALKPGGRLAILEPSVTSARALPRQEQTSRHQIAPDLVLRDVREAGFEVVALEDPFKGGDAHAGKSEWILVAVPQGTPTSTPADRSEPSTAFDPAAARLAFADFVRVHSTGGVIVLDTRDSESYARAHIPGAILAPMSALRELTPSLKAATKPIVAYCACPAEETSLRAVQYLRRQGVMNVLAVTGGWDRWVKEGLPVAAVDRAPN